MSWHGKTADFMQLSEDTTWIDGKPLESRQLNNLLKGRYLDLHEVTVLGTYPAEKGYALGSPRPTNGVREGLVRGPFI